MGHSVSKSSTIDFVSIGVCAFIWGTTWYAITFQLGAIDPLVSVCYRFALAGVLMLGWAKLRGEKILLEPRQYAPVLGTGFFTFAANYPLVYLAEERLTSAIVAVCFAGHSLANTIVFRFLLGDRASLSTWLGGLLGAAGVALTSWNELTDADLGARAQIGLAIAVAAVFGAAVGNLWARKSQESGAPIIASTGWAMASGAAILAVFIPLSGRSFEFDPHAPYVLSLLYLAVFGSVVAFWLYYSLAQRRGFGLASYIGALSPIMAMIVSALFEAKIWGPLAFVGIAVVLVGQWVMLRPART